MTASCRSTSQPPLDDPPPSIALRPYHPRSRSATGISLPPAPHREAGTSRYRCSDPLFALRVRLVGVRVQLRILRGTGPLVGDHGTEDMCGSTLASVGLLWAVGLDTEKAIGTDSCGCGGERSREAPAYHSFPPRSFFRIFLYSFSPLFY